MANETSIVEETSWKDGIAKEIRFSAEGNDLLGKFDDKDPTGMGTSYLELQKMSSGMMKIPTDESSTEERSSFYQKMGMPGDVSGYTKPTITEGMTLDEEFFGDMAGIAHAEGVSDKQFSAFVNRVIERQVKAAELQVAEETRINEEAEKKLHEDWGVDYDKNVEVSKRALRELVPDDMKEAFTNILVENNLDNNPIFIKAMNSIGAKMLDDTLERGKLIEDKKDDFKPKFPKSPEMYATMEGEEGVRSRKFFEDTMGHVYE